MFFAHNVGISINLASIAEGLDTFTTTVLIGIASKTAHIYLSHRARQANKHIAGAKIQVLKHLESIGSASPNDPHNRDWLKHIKKHLKNIKKYAERLKGKAKNETLKFVEEQANNLKELADKWGVPWDI